jgi:hypothetical protein
MTKRKSKKSKRTEVIHDLDQAVKLKMLEEAEETILSIGAEKLAWFFQFALAIGWLDVIEPA